MNDCVIILISGQCTVSDHVRKRFILLSKNVIAKITTNLFKLIEFMIGKKCAMQIFCRNHSCYFLVELLVMHKYSERRCGDYGELDL